MTIEVSVILSTVKDLLELSKENNQITDGKNQSHYELTTQIGP